MSLRDPDHRRRESGCTQTPSPPLPPTLPSKSPPKSGARAVRSDPNARLDARRSRIEKQPGREPERHHADAERDVADQVVAPDLVDFARLAIRRTVFVAERALLAVTADREHREGRERGHADAAENVRAGRNG